MLERGVQDLGKGTSGQVGGVQPCGWRVDGAVGDRHEFLTSWFCMLG